MTTEQYDRESEIESIVKLILQESQKSAFIEKIKFKIEQDYQGGSLRVIFGNENKNNISVAFRNHIWFSSDRSISKRYTIWVYNREYPSIDSSVLEDICFEMTGFMDEFYEVSTKQKGFSKEV